MIIEASIHWKIDVSPVLFEQRILFRWKRWVDGMGIWLYWTALELLHFYWWKLNEFSHKHFHLVVYHETKRTTITKENTALEKWMYCGKTFTEKIIRIQVDIWRRWGGERKRISSDWTKISVILKRLFFVVWCRLWSTFFFRVCNNFAGSSST